MALTLQYYIIVMIIKQNEIERLKKLGASNSEARAIVDTYKYLLPDDDSDIEAAREEIRMSAERWRADLERIERRKGWSNSRIANWIEGRLVRAGFDIRRHGNGSIYIDIYKDDQYVCDIRVADHAQPIGGGYKGHDDILGDVRHGDTDILVDPDNPDWRAAVDDVIVRSKID